jgi:integrase
MPKHKRGNSEGSIYRMQDGRWRAAVTCKDANGSPKRKTFTAATRHEVQGELAKALRDLQLGIPIVSEKQTVERFLSHWLEQIIKNQVRPKTLRTYSDLVKLHISPGIGHIALGKLSPQQVREFLNVKLASGLSPRTVKHLLVTLRGALAVAVKDGQIPRNAAALVDPPRVPRSEHQVFTPDQAREFLTAAKGNRLEALFTVAVSLGMREGEILGLKWSDVDLDAGMLTVRAALQRVNKRLTLVEPKSARSWRPIELPAVAVSALRHHQARQDQERIWAGSQWKETGHVFTTRHGTALDARDMLRSYYKLIGRKARRRVKEPQQPEPAPRRFPVLRFHDLRHSAATLLLAQGVSAKYITELLGHSQVSFTMQTYAHVLKESQQQVASKMDDILNPAPVATSVATKLVSGMVN